MTTMMTPTEELISADADIKATKQEVTDREKAEQDAQTAADDTRGLEAAASRDLQSAQDRYRVLSAAYEEAKGLREEEKRIEEELKEIGRAEQVRDAMQTAATDLDNAVNVVTPIESATQQAQDTTGSAKSLVQEAKQLVASAGGQQEAPTGTPAKTPSRTQKTSPSDTQNSLEAIITQLEADYEQLGMLYTQLQGFLTSLQQQDAVVKTAATEAADSAKKQEAEKSAFKRS